MRTDLPVSAQSAHHCASQSNSPYFEISPGNDFGRTILLRRGAGCQTPPLRGARGAAGPSASQWPGAPALLAGPAGGRRRGPGKKRIEKLLHKAWPVPCEGAVLLLLLWRNGTPGCAGERKKAFAVSSERSGMVYNSKKLQHATGKPRLREAGQVMQKAEHSVPLERLAGSMPFQGLRKPPAVPGGLTSMEYVPAPPAGAPPAKGGRPSGTQAAQK